jgi:hypothetical protein
MLSKERLVVHKVPLERLRVVHVGEIRGEKFSYSRLSKSVILL